jgi:autotransporter-associated beta strand protein
MYFLKQGDRIMRTCSSKTLIALGATVMVFAATSLLPAQRPQGPNPWTSSNNSGQWNNQYMPQFPFPSTMCFAWWDFEHAWARQGGFTPTFQVNPALQPAGFDPFGNDWSTLPVPGGTYPMDVWNSGMGGVTRANQTVTGPVYSSYSNTRTANASSGSCSATATAGVIMQEIYPPPYYQQSFILGTWISGSATGGAGNAFKLASSTAHAYTAWPMIQQVNGRWQWTWGWMLAGTSHTSGRSAAGASDRKEEYDLGAIRPAVKHVSYATIQGPDGSTLLQDTMSETVSTIDFAMEDGVEASIRWESDQLSFMNVRDGRFCVRIAGEYVPPEDQGEIDIIKHNGVVTTSRHTGIFNTTALPPVGTEGDFTLILSQTGEFGYSLPAVPGATDANLYSCALDADPPAIWGGEGANPNWSTQDNWLYAAPPGNDVPIYFTGLLPEGGQSVSNNDLPPGAKFNAIIFRPEVNATYTLQGNSIVLDGLIQNTSMFPQLINLDIFLPSGGGVTFDAALSDAALSDFAVDGQISGPGTLTKAGGGILILSNDNTYSGGTTINDGVLELADDGQIAASSGIEVVGSAIFRVRGGNHTVSAITGDGVTEVLSGSLTTSSLTQGTLAVGGARIGSTVPEPGTLILLLMAGLGLLLVARRRN